MTVLCVVVLLAGGSAPPNLCPNGDFEKGSPGGPASWQRPDGLTCLWVKDPLRKGKCMLLDTDVLLSQVRKRKEDMQKKPPPPPPRKLPTKGKEYRTVAASVGVSYYCTWIPIRRGVRYRLGVDARCEGRQRAVKVFVKGYIEDPRRPPEFRRRVAYKKYLSCRATPVWQRFSCEFSPTARTEKVRWIRVMLFSAWPPGVTYFDNVAVREVRATPKGNVPR